MVAAMSDDMLAYPHRHPMMTALHCHSMMTMVSPQSHTPFPLLSDNGCLPSPPPTTAKCAYVLVRGKILDVKSEKYFILHECNRRLEQLSQFKCSVLLC